MNTEEFLKAKIDIATRHEEELKWPAFNEETAWNLGNKIRSLFLERKNEKVPEYESASVVISITLFNGHILFQTSVGPDCKPDNWNWIRRKTNTVQRFGRSSYLQGRHQNILQILVPEADHAIHGGAFPILLQGHVNQPIGVIAVSGLPQAHDHQLVVDSIRAVIRVPLVDARIKRLAQGEPYVEVGRAGGEEFVVF
ncbi:hypothetical protein DL96DRAFT_1538184 [Flagelloscypha sp. PMI_526]|nr:hypothetical protein DL96DRAFT_1538184 [Flagelloscypha sp. PMI_526]